MHTQSAQAAKQIKGILKSKYPKIKFSVKSENYSGGNSVRVHYMDGVPTEEIEKLINQYQYGHFDGMIDLYEYSNSRDDIPQTKYLFVNRDISPENKQKITETIMRDYGLAEWNDTICMEKLGMWADQKVWKESQKMTF